MLQNFDNSPTIFCPRLQLFDYDMVVRTITEHHRNFIWCLASYITNAMHSLAVFLCEMGVIADLTVIFDIIKFIIKTHSIIKSLPNPSLSSSSSSLLSPSTIFK